MVKKLGLKVGQKVKVDKVPEIGAVLIQPSDSKKKTKGVHQEFQKWLDSFLEEDGALLDELAHR